MANGRDHALGRADEGGPHFRDKLLAGVSGTAAPAGQVAVEPRAMAGPVGQFMETGAIIVDLLAEGRLRRDLDEVRAGRVEGALAADAEVRAGRVYQRLGGGNDLAFRQGRGFGGEPVQPLALGEVEHGEAFEEGHHAGVLARLAGAFLFGFGGEAVGIDDGGSALALPDRSARRQRLLEGQPALRGIAALDDRAPQQQDVDARIAPPGRGVAREAGRGPSGAAPRLHPRETARLKLGDDLACDLIIEVGARLAIRGGRSPLPALCAGAGVGCLAHTVPPSPPKNPTASPRSGGGRRGDLGDAPREAGVHPKGRNEVPEPAAGRLGARRGASRRERRPQPAHGRGPTRMPAARARRP